MSIDYERYEASSTPISLTIQGDAGGFQVALVAHVDDHATVDEHLDRMRRAFIRQRSHMDLTLVLAELGEKRQELRDSPVIIEATERAFVVQHAERVANYREAWADKNKFGDYKPSTTERENLAKLRTDRDTRIAAVKAQMEALPLIIQQLEERAENLRKMIEGKDRHEVIEEHFAKQVLGPQRLPAAE